MYLPLFYNLLLDKLIKKATEDGTLNAILEEVKTEYFHCTNFNTAAEINTSPFDQLQPR